MPSAPSYRQLVEDASARLYDTSESPKIDAEILLLHVIDRPLAWLLANGEIAADQGHIQHFEQLINARHSGEPVAYLLGYRDFWSLRLTVNPHVLIPRADTETLVEQALKILKNTQTPRVLDLGTGSGAIALAIAKERLDADVIAIDSQPDALQVARHNAGTNKIENVSFLLSDWFSAIKPKSEKFDLIAANPPYVHAHDPHLERGDLRFEPNTALISTGQGLADLSHIIKSAPNYLKSSGDLIVEHGFEQHKPVAALFKAAGFKHIKLTRDINDLPRCTQGKLHENG